MCAIGYIGVGRGLSLLWNNGVGVHTDSIEGHCIWLFFDLFFEEEQCKGGL